jgi:hypothetical protein
VEVGCLSAAFGTEKCACACGVRMGDHWFLFVCGLG